MKNIGKTLTLMTLAPLMLTMAGCGSDAEPVEKTANGTTVSDDSLKAMMSSGDIAKLYDKWFMQPIAPTNTKVGLALSDATKQAWAAPNDKPVEEYMKK